MSTLRASLVEACQLWTNPKLATRDRKVHWLEQGRIPTPEEEAVLATLLEATTIPAGEFGGVCLVAENVRRGQAERALADEASQQIADGMVVLDYTADRYLRWPWQSLHDLTGAMAPGTVHIVACPSKGGKTTLMRSATDLWARNGDRIYFGGFEMPAKMLRAMYAADECGVDPGDVVTGAWLSRPDKDELRLRLREAFQRQEDPASHHRNIAYSAFSHVTTQAIRTMMRQAADWGAKAVIVDHTEHVDVGMGGNAYGTAVAVCQLLESAAKEYEVVVIATSQLNTADKRTDPWRDHRALRTEHVAFGAKKEQIATTMFGFVRPVKPDLTKEEKSQVESRERSVYDMLIPHVNQANLIASRPYASRIGNRALVGWERGRIVDLPPNMALDVQASQHGIKLGTKY